MHKLLIRQLRKLLPPEIPQDAIQDLLSAVNATYEQSDLDRLLLERSLDQITQTQEQLASSLSLLDSTLHATADALLVVDLSGNAIIANAAFLSLFELDAVSNANPLDALSLRRHINHYILNLDELYNLIRHTTHHVTAHGACELQLRDGRHIDCRTQPRTMENQPVGRVWSLSDITALKKREQEALFNTYHDSLTGLPNRVLFTQHLS
ncbi:MAG: hypothetical protein IPM37_13280 [Hahellaceae bacterium]|nr:hypothetical protein [Hahellaceae bacterium]